MDKPSRKNRFISCIYDLIDAISLIAIVLSNDINIKFVAGFVFLLSKISKIKQYIIHHNDFF